MTACAAPEACGGDAGVCPGGRWLCVMGAPWGEGCPRDIYPAGSSALDGGACPPGFMLVYEPPECYP